MYKLYKIVNVLLCFDSNTSCWLSPLCSTPSASRWVCCPASASVPRLFYPHPPSALLTPARPSARSSTYTQDFFFGNTLVFPTHSASVQRHCNEQYWISNSFLTLPIKRFLLKFEETMQWIQLYNIYLAFGSSRLFLKEINVFGNSKNRLPRFYTFLKCNYLFG